MEIDDDDGPWLEVDKLLWSLSDGWWRCEPVTEFLRRYKEFEVLHAQVAEQLVPDLANIVLSLIEPQPTFTFQAYDVPLPEMGVSRAFIDANHPLDQEETYGSLSAVTTWLKDQSRVRIFDDTLCVDATLGLPTDAPPSARFLFYASMGGLFEANAAFGSKVPCLIGRRSWSLCRVLSECGLTGGFVVHRKFNGDLLIENCVPAIMTLSNLTEPLVAGCQGYAPYVFCFELVSKTSTIDFRAELPQWLRKVLFCAQWLQVYLAHHAITFDTLLASLPYFVATQKRVFG